MILLKSEGDKMVNKSKTIVNTLKKQDIYKTTTKVNDSKKQVNKSKTSVNKTKKQEKVYKETTKVNKPASGVVDKSNTEVNTTKELSVYKDITKVNAKVKNDIIEVAGLKDKINELIEWYETKHKNVIEIPELKMEKRHFTGDVVVKSYRIYSDIVKKFETFSKKQDQYKIQDLVSQALLEFMEKYH